MARLPKTGQGLGMLNHGGRRFSAPPGLHPPHAAKTMQSRIMFSDRGSCENARKFLHSLDPEPTLPISLGTGGLRLKGRVGVTEAPSAAPYLDRCGPVIRGSKRAAQRSVTSREGQRRKSEISASGGCPFGLAPNVVMERTLRRILTAVTAAAALLISAFRHIAAA